MEEIEMYKDSSNSRQTGPCIEAILTTAIMHLCHFLDLRLALSRTTDLVAHLLLRLNRRIIQGDQQTIVKTQTLDPLAKTMNGTLVKGNGVLKTDQRTSDQG